MTGWRLMGKEKRKEKHRDQGQDKSVCEREEMKVDDMQWWHKLSWQFDSEGFWKYYFYIFKRVKWCDFNKEKN